MGMLISNEPDFMIHGVLKYQLFGQDFWITTTTIGMWIITALILILAVLANRTLKRATDQPGTFQNVLEMAYEALQGMTAMQDVSSTTSERSLYLSSSVT